MLNPFAPAEFTALLLLSTAASFTPGPNTTLSTALAANRGLRGAWHFVLAVPLGWGLLFTLCAGGLGTLIFTGISNDHAVKIWVGALSVCLLSITVDLSLASLERRLTHGRAA